MNTMKQLKFFSGAKYVLVSPSKYLIEATVFGRFSGNGTGEYVVFKVDESPSPKIRNEHPPYTECKCKTPVEHMNATNAVRRKRKKA